LLGAPADLLKLLFQPLTAVRFQDVYAQRLGVGDQVLIGFFFPLVQVFTGNEEDQQSFVPSYLGDDETLWIDEKLKLSRGNPVKDVLRGVAFVSFNPGADPLPN